MQSQRVTSVQVFPYYLGIATDVAPIISMGSGIYTTGQLLSSQYHRLDLDSVEILTELQTGGAYSWVGKLENGRTINSHWLFCTSQAEAPTFGAICDLAQPGSAVPLLSDPATPLIRLEELTDITAVLSASHPEYGHAHAQLGRGGWLVMTTVTSPVCLGVLIDHPTVPASFAQGTEGLTITAKSKRTLQSIGMKSLYYAESGDAALFLKVGQHP